MRARVAKGCPLSPQEQMRVYRCRRCIDMGLAEQVNCKWFKELRKA